MMLNFIHWNVDPEIFTIGDWGPRWYGLLFALGFVVGYYIMLKFFKKEGVKRFLIALLCIFFWEHYLVQG